VNIETSFKYSGALNDELNGTVNYEQLYDIACSQMKQTKKLIETVAYAILEEIKASYPGLETIEVDIKKLNPPMGCKIDYSSVTVNYSKA
jgi:dihydroneopterin aldolase